MGPGSAGAEGSGSGIVSPPQYTTMSAQSAAMSAQGAAMATTQQSALDSAQPRDDFFDVVPQSDQTSFQVGYLGLEGFEAWIKGEVLIKLDENSRADRHLYQRCSVTLHAVEQDEEQAITLFTARQTLWERAGVVRNEQQAQDAGTSSSRLEELPTTLSFSLPLTKDLPHCIHLANSSLLYTLVATLESSDPATLPHAVREVPVHLTRYSIPGTLQDTASRRDGKNVESGQRIDGDVEPYRWSIDTPTPIFVQLQRTLFQRAEPICVHIRIPPPADRRLLTLGLRSIETNLVRVITNRRSGSKHELLLAHSGKLCRLHSTRSIILRLMLHPPFDASNMPYPHPDHDAAQGGPIHGRGGGGGCESVTQETLLHDVFFLVRIRIAIRGEYGGPEDIHLEQPVTILPGAAGGVDALEQVNEKRRALNEVSSSSRNKQDEAHSTSGAGPSTASAHAIDDDEEEYDGYEDVGRPLVLDDDEEELPVEVFLSHDIDVPPPTLLESQNDLQVEVDVEGVGAGVLRDRQSAPDLPGGYTWREDEVGPESPQENFGASTSGDGNLVSYDEHESPPSFQVVADGIQPQSPSSARLGHSRERPFTTQSGNLATGTQRPPPYMAASLRAASNSYQDHQNLPSFTGQQPDDNTPRSSRHSQGNAAGTSAEEESFPPAYPHPPPNHFSAQHPPSYEA